MANIVKCSYEMMTPLDREIGKDIVQFIEKVARTCYKSEEAITEQSGEKMVASLVRSGHLAMLEHVSLTVKFYTDRGVTHEIVRHRVASYAQESTRYCNYGKDKFNGEITLISPWNAMVMKKPDEPEGALRVGKWYDLWVEAVDMTDNYYQQLISEGCPPEIARGVLPQSTKSEIVVTYNLREWLHFFSLRVLGTTGKPHPQIYEVAKPVLYKFAECIPCVFGGLVERLKTCDPYADNPAEQGGLANATP